MGPQRLIGIVGKDMGVAYLLVKYFNLKEYC